jgi:thioredoxin 1
MVQDVTDETFDAFVKESPVAVIDCWAAWCAPCRFLSPVVEELAKEHGEVSFGKLNVDENREVPVRFGIMSIPTLLYFKDGSLVDKTIGALPKEAVENRLKRILA